MRERKWDKDTGRDWWGQSREWLTGPAPPRGARPTRSVCAAPWREVVI